MKWMIRLFCKVFGHLHTVQGPQLGSISYATFSPLQCYRCRRTTPIQYEEAS